MKWRPLTSAQIESRANKIAARRRRNPVRDARRQAHLTRMKQGRVEFEPVYSEIRNGRDVVARHYIRHVKVQRRAA